MKLFGKGTSRSFRCVWAAEEAGVDYDYIEVAFGSDADNGANSNDYRELNPQGKVPTLVDDIGGRPLVLTESAAIVTYLAENSDQNLIPSVEDRFNRAQYEQLMFFALSDLEQPLWTNGKHRFAMPKEYRVPDVLATTHWEFTKSQKALVSMIGETPEYALGSHFTAADIVLAHTLAWAENFKYELLPGLKAYKDRLYEREACKKALAKMAAQ